MAKIKDALKDALIDNPLEIIQGKDENYYINRCSSQNKIKETYDGCYGSKFYNVEDKTVELQERYVESSPDDYDVELDKVIITNNLPY